MCSVQDKLRSCLEVCKPSALRHQLARCACDVNKFMVTIWCCTWFVPLVRKMILKLSNSLICLQCACEVDCTIEKFATFGTCNELQTDPISSSKHVTVCACVKDEISLSHMPMINKLSAGDLCP